MSIHTKYYCHLCLIAVPSKPLNLTVLDVTSRSITMSWLPPKNQNGAITGYHVFHKHDNQTEVEIVKRNSIDSIIRYEIPKLSKYYSESWRLPPLFNSVTLTSLNILLFGNIRQL